MRLRRWHLAAADQRLRDDRQQRHVSPALEDAHPILYRNGSFTQARKPPDALFAQFLGLSNAGVASGVYFTRASRREADGCMTTAAPAPLRRDPTQIGDLPGTLTACPRPTQTTRRRRCSRAWSAPTTIHVKRVAALQRGRAEVESGIEALDGRREEVKAEIVRYEAAKGSSLVRATDIRPYTIPIQRIDRH